MQYTTKYLYCLLFLLTAGVACHKPYYIQQHSDKFYAIPGSAGTDSNFVKMLLPYKRVMDTQMQIIIGTTDTMLSKRQPESNLGNFVADVLLSAGRKTDATVDAAIFNYGGLRLPYINAGNITTGKMYELMPFDNAIAIVEIPGKVLHQFCNHMAAYNGWPVSNMSYLIKDRTAINIRIRGIPLDTLKTYKIVTNDYVASGGDYCSFLLPLRRTNTNVFIRDVLIAHVKELTKQNRPLHPYIEKRVRYAE